MQELNKNIGKTATYTADGEVNECVVLNARHNFGRTDYEVRYQVIKWVQGDSLEFEE